MEPAGHAFISYAREDSPRVDRLQLALEAAGIAVWRDASHLWPGEDWRIKVQDAINKNSLAFIACFSSRNVSTMQTNQNAELRLAADQFRRRRIGDPWLIPVRLDDCRMPDLDLGGGQTLNSIQRVDLFGADRELSLVRLVVGVLGLLRYAPRDFREPEAGNSPTKPGIWLHPSDELDNM
jgi:hypothetical protein